MTDDTMPDIELYLEEIEADEADTEQSQEERQLTPVPEEPEPEPEENVEIVMKEPEIAEEDMVFDLPKKPKKEEKATKRETTCQFSEGKGKGRS
ncbi:MAG TPA: hypothetical protein DCM40_45455 [Maribacter sp.]|nr:hypothetical protein [Maribacter sp.]